MLDKSKLVAPKDYSFHDIARERANDYQEREREDTNNYNEFEERSHDTLELDSNNDLKNVFNQSLSYIQLLRVASPTDTKRIS